MKKYCQVKWKEVRNRRLPVWNWQLLWCWKALIKTVFQKWLRSLFENRLLIHSDWCSIFKVHYAGDSRINDFWHLCKYPFKKCEERWIIKRPLALILHRQLFTSKYQSLIGLVLVILSQFWWTSKSVLKYAGMSNVFMHTLIVKSVKSYLRGYLDDSILCIYDYYKSHPLIAHDSQKHRSDGEDAQHHHRVIYPWTRAGLIVISVLSILDIKDWFTFKIFLIPCPFFVAYSFINKASLDFAWSAQNSRLRQSQSNSNS